MIAVANEKVGGAANEFRRLWVADGHQNICPLNIQRVIAHEEQPGRKVDELSLETHL